MQAAVRMRDTWTVSDIYALEVPDWWRYEIVDGSLTVSPPAGRWHEFVAEDLRAAIRRALPPGNIVVGPVGVAFGTSYRAPDLVVVRRNSLADDGPFEPAEVLLAVEVVSPGSVTTDRVTKPTQYAAAGIRNFWRMETESVSLSAYALDGDGGPYREIGNWGSGQVAELREPFPVTVVIDDLGRAH